MTYKLLKPILSSLFFLLISMHLHAQFNLGILGGMSTSDITASELVILNEQDAESFNLAATEADYGIHFGFFIRGQIGRFYLEPSVIFNSSSIDYSLEELTGDGAVRTIKRETYQYLDLPLIAGFKFGIFRLGAGPVGHVFIDSSSELLDVDGYRQKFREMTWGWQANVGLDIWLIRLDLKYEGNFSKYGEHFEFFGEQYQFDRSPSRLIASVGLIF